MRTAFLSILLGVALVGSSSVAAEELLCVGEMPNKLALIDMSTDKVVAEVTTRHHTPLEIVPSASGHRAYVTTNLRETVEVLDVARRVIIDEITFSAANRRVRIWGLATSPDDRYLYMHVNAVKLAASDYLVERPEIVKYDLRSQQIVEHWHIPEGAIFRLVISRDGKKLFALGRAIYRIDTDTGRIEETWQLYKPLRPTMGPWDIFNIYGYEEQSGVYSAPFVMVDPVKQQPVSGLLLVDTETKNVEFFELGPATVVMFSTVVAADRKWAYGIHYNVTKIDLKNRRIVGSARFVRNHLMGNLSRDGKKLYVSGNGPEVDVVSTKTLKLLRNIPLSGDTADTYMRVVRGR